MPCDLLPPDEPSIGFDAHKYNAAALECITIVPNAKLYIAIENKPCRQAHLAQVREHAVLDHRVAHVAAQNCRPEPNGDKPEQYSQSQPASVRLSRLPTLKLWRARPELNRRPPA